MTRQPLLLWQEQLRLFLLPMVAMLRYAPRLHYKALQIQPIGPKRLSMPAAAAGHREGR
jgi:hypothetical protein